MSPGFTSVPKLLPHFRAWWGPPGFPARVHTVDGYGPSWLLIQALVSINSFAECHVVARSSRAAGSGWLCRPALSTGYLESMAMGKRWGEPGLLPGK